MARRFVMLVKESSYGTPKASPVMGTDAIYIRLTSDATMTSDPIIQFTPDGGGDTTQACAWSDQNQSQGSLSTLLYPSQAAFLLGWAFTTVNAGRTTPWVTTDAGDANSEAGVMPPGDLASVSVYDAVEESDGSITRVRHAGVKAGSGSLTAVSTDAGRAFVLNMQLLGMRDDRNAAGETSAPDATEFPEPTEADMPCGPYVFSDTEGGLKIGTTRTLYDKLTLAWTSTVDQKYFEGSYPKFVRFYGRSSTTLNVGLYRKKSPDDLAAFKALTKFDTEFTIDDGANWTKVDLNTNNVWASLPRNLPDGSTYGWDATLRNMKDRTTGIDVAITSGVHEEEGGG